MDYQKADLPPTPDTPDGFRFTVCDSECKIDHVRVGMGCLNLFVTVWLVFWTFGCIFLIRAYAQGRQMENGSPIQLWFVLAFVIPWFIVAYLLLYLRYSRKSFHLSEQALHVVTRLFFVSWNVTFPRNTISHVRQIKDGGEGEDSFPSWGLQIKSAAAVGTFIQKLVLLNNFGRKIRYRSLLSRLPYKQSKWLAIVIARWAGAELELCPNPETPG